MRSLPSLHLNQHANRFRGSRGAIFLGAGAGRVQGQHDVIAGILALSPQSVVDEGGFHIRHVVAVAVQRFENALIEDVVGIRNRLTRCSRRRSP